MSATTLRETTLTVELANARAEECRALAGTLSEKPHVIMLMHMFATWGRIAEDLAKAEPRV
jgi:hypothetical protein